MFGYNGNNNMMNPTQQRLNYMERQFPQFSNNNFMPQQQMQIPLKGRIVTNLEEVKASQIDMDGSLHFFPDSSSGKIYTKRLNIDGTSSIDVYEKVIPKETTPEANNSFVTREEYNNVVNNLKEVNAILTGILGGMNYGKSNASNKGNDADDGSKPESTNDVTADGTTEPIISTGGKNGRGKKQ